jgi:hypothetical protein
MNRPPAAGRALAFPGEASTADRRSAITDGAASSADRAQRDSDRPPSIVRRTVPRHLDDARR